MESTKKLVTILVPNYKTPEITKICMRLLRKHTNFNMVDIIAIDNHSQDESLIYLKALSRRVTLDK
jgi:glycosyltransferase involved in cell wall biosynthesis